MEKNVAQGKEKMESSDLSRRIRLPDRDGKREGPRFWVLEASVHKKELTSTKGLGQKHT